MQPDRNVTHLGEQTGFVMRSAFTQLLGPVAATVGLHLLFLVLYLGKFGWDPSAFICVGERMIGHYPFERITKACGPAGHDGQFYYALARAPWQRHGAEIDEPSLRHVRILYPALCWMLSAGIRCFSST